MFTNYFRGLLFFFFFFPSVLFAQTTKKQNSAVRITVAPQIDGKLDDEAWKNVVPAADFVQLRPYNGKEATQKSVVKFIYDDVALYIGAMLYDTAPDSILTYLSRRDEIGASDYFGVYLDPFNDGQTAYGFFVNAAGVQTDMRASDNSDMGEDSNWDAVWHSEVRVNDKGWAVEIKIPYSALRFPKQAVQTWGLNMFRNIQRMRQNTSWNLINLEIMGFVKQQGEMTGIKDVVPPVRLSVTPYLSAYVENYTEDHSWVRSFKGGMDLKYGINESFTLDMILVPDFGQVQSDDHKLNLTPFETYYDEKRPFFMEGTEMFDKANIFYSRRIGGTPLKYDQVYDDIDEETEEVIENPGELQMINATKVTGKTKKGLGIGVLNAMTAPSYAKIRNKTTHEEREYQTQPFTNYNVLVFDQSLKNNSFVSVINTNYNRISDGYIANVTGSHFKLANKKDNYAITGQGAASQIYEQDSSANIGYYYNVGFEKTKGKFTFDLSQRLETDNYQPNDLGYIQSNNEVSHNLALRYSINEPFWKILTWYNRFFVEQRSLYKPYKYSSTELMFRSFATFKNQLTMGLFLNASPFKSNDFYESRVDNRVFVLPSYLYIGTYISTDYRKPLAMEIEFGGWKANADKLHGFEGSIEPRIRFNDKASLSYSLSYSNEKMFGYVNHTNSDSIYFGLRDGYTISNTMNLKYIFNNKSYWSFRLRHYWSRAEYKEFYMLNSDGLLNTYSEYTENADINYNSFNIDMVYTWRFAPGSELSIVWKNAINHEDTFIVPNFIDNLRQTVSSPQINSFSVRILYYLDYLYLKSKI